MFKTSTTHSYGVTANEAFGEKQEMVKLNDVLAQYMQRVRDLKKCAVHGGEAESYSMSMKQIESQISEIRSLYDNELLKLRRKLEQAIKEKNSFAADAQMLVEIQGRLSIESKRVKQLEVCIKELELTVAELRKENSFLAGCLKKAQGDASFSGATVKDNEDLKLKLTEQMKINSDLRDRNKELSGKLQFDSKLHSASNAEMQQRIRAANVIIQKLEAKMKQLNHVGENLPGALAKMREGTVAELKKFQMETEQSLNQNIEFLKKQMEYDSKAKDELAGEHRHLEVKMQKMTAMTVELQAKVKASEQENMALRSEMDHERARSQVVIKELEHKLKSLQFTLMGNSKEFLSAREAQASLKAEIETYRRLLEVESSRLGQCRISSRCNGSAKPSTPAVHGRAEKISMWQSNGVSNGRKSAAGGSFPLMDAIQQKYLINAGNDYRMASPGKRHLTGSHGGAHSAHSSYQTSYSMDYAYKGKGTF